MHDPATSSFWSMHPRYLVLLAFTSAIVGCSRATPGTPAIDKATFDVVIENGRIVDGTGNPWTYGDVGIRGARIVAVTQAGVLHEASAKLRIDAHHHIVAPGFIDLQGQSIAALTWGDGRVVSKVTQGVTTEILGEGTTPGPSNAHVDSLGDVQTMEPPPPPALLQTFQGEHGFGAWLDAMRHHRNSINAGSFLGAQTVRASVMGFKAGAPNAAELDSMRAVVRNAMREGAFGIASALIYPPGSYAGTNELIELAKAMAPFHGEYITHMRSEDDSLFEAMDEAFRIAREGGVRLEIFHLKASNRRNWSKAPEMVAKIDSARASGLDVGATMYPYPFSGNNLGECFPDWAAENGKLMDNLKNPETRSRILNEMADPKGDPLCQIEGPSAYLIADFKRPEYAKYEGKRLSEIAADMKKPWPETVIELITTEGRDLSKINFTMSEDNVKMQIKSPWVVIGTDADGVDPDSTKIVVHPRAYGSYPRILGRYVREQKLFPLEEAIRKMSGGVAQRLGLQDRGLIREGMYADIVVFDDATIIDLATPEKPHQISKGVEEVFVNGVQVLHDGKHTGATPGQVITGPGTVTR
jgi:N-acyl-D-amino-acid deacylase